MRGLAVVLTVALVSSSAFAEALLRATPEDVGMSSERLERLDSAMQKYVDDDRLAGVVTLLARRGKVAHLGAYGMADREAGVAMAPDTIFRIASMSKAITSTAAMMLYEEGALALDDPVSKHLPEFADTMVSARVEMPEEGEDQESEDVYELVHPTRPMTVRHLLTHTSGLTYAGGRMAPLFEGVRHSGGFVLADFTLEEMVKDVAAVPLAFHPGEQWHYGYSTDVLGRVVEAVSGATLAEFFDERIFKPLGMEDTAFYLPSSSVPRLAAVYSPQEEGTGLARHRDEDGPPNTYPDAGPQKLYCGGGGLSATILDYARFCQMILNGGELDGVRILSPTTVRMMGRDNLGEDVDFGGGNRFGLGFLVHTDAVKSRHVSGEGTLSWGGFWHTDFWIDPEEELVGILMTQILPATGLDDHAKFRTLAYQAIVD
jgi:CubicO group peptidase (beta-lactamase class C family)